MQLHAGVIFRLSFHISGSLTKKRKIDGSEKAPYKKGATTSAMSDTQHFKLSFLEEASYISLEEKVRVAKDVAAGNHPC